MQTKITNESYNKESGEGIVVLLECPYTFVKSGPMN